MQSEKLPLMNYIDGKIIFWSGKQKLVHTINLKLEVKQSREKLECFSAFIIVENHLIYVLGLNI